MSVKSLKMNAKKVGVAKATVNFINAMIGTGILAIPYAVGQSGFFAGTLLLIIVCIIQAYIVVKLSVLAEKYEVESFDELSQLIGGNWLYYATCIFSAMFTYGALIFYHKYIHRTNIYLIKYIPQSETYHSLYSNLATGLVLVLFVIPLSLMRDMSILGFSSGLGVAIFGITVIFIFIVGGINYPEVDKNLIKHDILNLHGFFGAIGTLSFSFVCTDSFLNIYRSLKVKTQPTMNKVIANTLGFLGFVYTIFAVISCSLIADIAEMILETESLQSKYMSAIRGSYTFVIIFTFPLTLYITRSYIYSIIQRLIGRFQDMPRKKVLIIHFVTTLLLISTTFGISLVVDSFSLIVSLTGLSSSTVIGFVIPVIIIFKEKKMVKVFKDFREGISIKSGISAWERFVQITNFLFPIFIFVFGAIAFAIGTPYEIIDYINK